MSLRLNILLADAYTRNVALELDHDNESVVILLFDTVATNPKGDMLQWLQSHISKHKDQKEDLEERSLKLYQILNHQLNE